MAKHSNVTTMIMILVNPGIAVLLGSIFDGRGERELQGIIMEILGICNNQIKLSEVGGGIISI